MFCVTVPLTYNIRDRRLQKKKLLHLLHQKKYKTENNVYDGTLVQSYKKNKKQLKEYVILFSADNNKVRKKYSIYMIYKVGH